jgi:hypothetical protein
MRARKILIMAAVLLVACQPLPGPSQQSAARGDLEESTPPIVVELPPGTPETPKPLDQMGSEDAQRDSYCTGVLLAAMKPDLPEQRMRDLSTAYAEVGERGGARLESEGFDKLDAFSIFRHWQERGEAGRAIGNFSPNADDCIARSKGS